MREEAAARLATREAELNALHTRQANDAKTKAQDEMHALREQLEEDLRQARDENVTLAKRLQSSSDEADALREALQRAELAASQAQQAGETLRAALQEEIRRAHESHAATLEAERVDAKLQMERLLSEQVAETQRLTSEFSRAQSLLQQELEMAKEALRELQSKFDFRESRPEDLHAIEQLNKMVREKDELVRRTYEEMKYFKLELQNRRRTSTRTSEVRRMWA